jgi:hypothetical protein
LILYKTTPKGIITADTTHSNHSTYHIEDNPNLKGFYPVAEEEVPSDILKANGPQSQMILIQENKLNYRIKIYTK